MLDAVAVSIDNFQTGAVLSQCDAANTVLSLAFQGLGNCCANPLLCDKVWYLREALDALGILNDAPGSGTGAGPMPFLKLMSEIDSGRPVGIQIEWFGGAFFHYAVIAGYSNNSKQRVKVYDPNGPAAIISWMDYTVFTHSHHYQSTTDTGGRWVDSFAVK